ncbi:MAG: hypothetical protein QOH46_1290 [Solirubrobacteraceae bacterium]|nr:hypothetical protein [Solirubrobacteraceae bacterium]
MIMDPVLGRNATMPALAAATAAACLLGAEAIHTAVIADHYSEWWAEGVFFFALSVLEGGLAVALVLAPGGRVCLAAVAVSVATIGVWVWSRTIGVPLGPGAGYQEPVGRADAVATLLESLTVLVLAPAAVRRPRPPRPAGRRGARLRPAAAAALAVALVTAFGLHGAGDHAHRTAPAGLTSNPQELAPP